MSPAPGERVLGVLLAAGGGSRFAGPTHKLLADLRGRPVLAHSLGNVTAARLPALVVVTGAADVSGLVPPGVVTVPNTRWEHGQATSVAAATAWAARHGFDAVVVGLGDQPGVVAAAWRAVAATASAPVAVATYGGRRGHPVRLHRDIWHRLPTSGDAVARQLMSTAPELVIEVACDGDPADVDTVEDLARWR